MGHLLEAQGVKVSESTAHNYCALLEDDIDWMCLTPTDTSTIALNAARIMQLNDVNDLLMTAIAAYNNNSY